MTPSRRIVEDAAREAFEIYRALMVKSAKLSIPEWSMLRPDVQAQWCDAAREVVR